MTLFLTLAFAGSDPYSLQSLSWMRRDRPTLAIVDESLAEIGRRIAGTEPELGADGTDPALVDEFEADMVLRRTSDPDVLLLTRWTNGRIQDGWVLEPDRQPLSIAALDRVSAGSGPPPDDRIPPEDLDVDRTIDELMSLRASGDETGVKAFLDRHRKPTLRPPPRYLRAAWPVDGWGLHVQTDGNDAVSLGATLQRLLDAHPELTIDLHVSEMDAAKGLAERIGDARIRPAIDTHLGFRQPRSPGAFTISPCLLVRGERILQSCSDADPEALGQAMASDPSPLPPVEVRPLLAHLPPRASTVFSTDRRDPVALALGPVRPIPRRLRDASASELAASRPDERVFVVRDPGTGTGGRMVTRIEGGESERTWVVPGIYPATHTELASMIASREQPRKDLGPALRTRGRALIRQATELAEQGEIERALALMDVIDAWYGDRGARVGVWTRRELEFRGQRPDLSDVAPGAPAPVGDDHVVWVLDSSGSSEMDSLLEVLHTWQTQHPDQRIVVLDSGDSWADLVAGLPDVPVVRARAEPGSLEVAGIGMYLWLVHDGVIVWSGPSGNLQHSARKRGLEIPLIP